MHYLEDLNNSASCGFSGPGIRRKTGQSQGSADGGRVVQHEWRPAVQIRAGRYKEAKVCSRWIESCGWQIGKVGPHSAFVTDEVGRKLQVRALFTDRDFNRQLARRFFSTNTRLNQGRADGRSVKWAHTAHSLPTKSVENFKYRHS